MLLISVSNNNYEVSVKQLKFVILNICSKNLVFQDPFDILLKVKLEKWACGTWDILRRKTVLGSADIDKYFFG